MTNDESPVDVAALGAAPPVDNEPLADTAAAPDAAPADTPSTPATPATRRRRPASTGSRTRRSTKSANSDAETTDAEPPATAEVEAPVTETAIEKTETPETPETPAPEPEKKPARGRRGGATARRKTAEPAAVEMPETPSEPAVAEQASIADAGTIPGLADASLQGTDAAAPVEAPPVEAPPAEKPKRGRRTTRKAREEAASEASPKSPEIAPAEPQSIEAVAAEAPPSPEAAAPETPTVEKTGRTRRGGRSRRREPAQTEPAESAAPSEAAAAVPVEEATTTPEAPAAEKPRRNRRGGRTRVEAAAEPEDLSRSGGRLVSRRGAVELQINGATYPPVVFFGSVDGEKEARRVTSEVQRAASSGVHIHSTLVELTCPLPPDDTVYETFDSRIETLVKADPKGYFIPRIVFVPAPGWRRQYPNEVNHYADGSTDDPSIASNHFWMEAENALAALIEHVSRMGYGERIVGYHLERGEWFHPAEGGYDRSFANREAFRAWLRAKYKNSEAALRAAWYDGTVQFYTADIPPLPTNSRPELAFFEPRKDRRWVDFLEYTSEVVADRLISLARVVKTASENRALVSVCYGYTFEFGHTFSGHLALQKLLESPVIDILAGPPSYRDRQPGGAGSFPGPVDSMPVHGKLWLSEDDTKTYLAPANASPDDFNPRIDSRHATEQVQKRAMGKSLAHRSAIAFMDTWGEGWLDSEEIWRSVGGFTSRYGDLVRSHKTWSPEVVVLIGEKSLLHLQKGDAFVRRILRDQHDILQQSGASVGFYLQSDVLAKNFPTDAKLYVFLTPYRMPADQRAAIKEKLQNGGKTVVWMYAPGVCDARGEPEEGAHEIVGITLRQQSWNSDIGSRIVDTRHPITEGIQNRHVGARERLNPSFSVDDDSPGITVIGEYVQSGLPSIAVREMANWRTVFCGEPALTAELFRGLCRYAGVHLYTTGGEDYVFAGDGWLTIHTARDGSRTIHLPPSRDLFSLDDMQLVAQNSSEHRLFMKGRTTYSFFVGTTDEMRKMGLPVERVSGRRRSSSEPVPPAPEALPAMESEEASTLAGETAPEAGSQHPAAGDALLSEVAVPVDLDGLLALDEPNPEGDEGEEGDETEDGPNGEGEEHPHGDSRRRRRRRGGRGRGRRHRPNGADAASNGGGAPPAAG